jgi:hypothetical protein
MALITLEQAKAHLRVVSVDEDDDIDRKIEQAGAIVLDYLKGQAVSGWNDGSVTVPRVVEAATLVMLTHLYENRGDDMTADEDAWKAVERLLMRFRDPALA